MSWLLKIIMISLIVNKCCSYYFDFMACIFILCVILMNSDEF